VGAGTVRSSGTLTTLYCVVVPAPDVARHATSSCEETVDELAVLVVRTAKAIVDRLRVEHPEGASSSMSVVHGLAARRLLGRVDVTTVELARYLGITKQSTSEVVAALERAGTIRRAPHPTDGRAQVLLLTEAGAAKLAEGRRRLGRLEDQWAEMVGRDRLDIVRDALEAYLASDLATRESV
jgi:DNA-binding MarR family transcriptional regulator